jgi:hypothetical protein
MNHVSLAFGALIAAATFGVSAKATVTFVDPAPTEKLDPRDPNYMRCRKMQVTGSLVKKDRVCKTNAEWAKIGEDMQRNADNLISRNRTGNDCRVGVGPAC